MVDIATSIAVRAAVDHWAYLVRDSEASACALRLFFPLRRTWRQPHAGQRVLISFLENADGARVELVEPLAEHTLLQKQLADAGRDCVPYHLCLRVDDFHAARECMRRQGWATLTRPFPALDPAELASHLYHPSAGMVEIIGPAAP
ncbi:glyoxalase [Xenophilus sp. AP218F]|nr:glyoxalase [Xenophilus sp. AP218F]